MAVTAAYTGTFDPLTEGHSNLIERVAGMFDNVLVAVASATGKETLFSHQERVEMARASLIEIPNVKVHGYTGMTVEFARKHNVTVLVRGLRSVADFEYEVQMDAMNKYLAKDVDTIYLTPPEHLRHVSSSLVRQVASLGGDVSPFVHRLVEAELRKRLEAKKGPPTESGESF